jgi:hypothetical protein
MRRNEYDTPAVALIEAFNACVGKTVPMVFLRDEFRFHLGGEPKRGQFPFWLEKMLAVPEVADSVDVINITRPGDYTRVWFKVAKPIELV